MEGRLTSSTTWRIGTARVIRVDAAERCVPGVMRWHTLHGIEPRALLLLLGGGQRAAKREEASCQRVENLGDATRLAAVPAARQVPTRADDAIVAGERRGDAPDETNVLDEHGARGDDASKEDEFGVAMGMWHAGQEGNGGEGDANDRRHKRVEGDEPSVARLVDKRRREEGEVGGEDGPNPISKLGGKGRAARDTPG